MSRRLAPAGFIAVALLSLLLVPSAQAAVGGLSQKPGTAGCISDDGTLGSCVDGAALNDANSVVISPDGANAYTASPNGGIAIFDRNAIMGALTQKAGTAGCISYDGTGGDCITGAGITSPRSVAISSDGANIYVASSAPGNSVAIFDRNPSTGALTQKPGAAGCVSQSGGACATGVALDNADFAAVSPDGKNVYVTAQNSRSIAIFDRNSSTGALIQKPGTAGCISDDAGLAGICVIGTALDGADSVAISPDGKNAYVTSRYSEAISIFDRSASTGALTQKTPVATVGCISSTGAGPCAVGTALGFPESVTVSPDGASVYVAAQAANGGVAIFDRSPSGTLTQKTGTNGCISDDGSAGACADGTALGGTNFVAVSSDATSAYATVGATGAVAIFDRSPSGVLTQRAGTSGCVSKDGTFGDCVDGTALDGAASVAISPNGANAYVTAFSGDALAIFDRDIPPETTIDSGPGPLTNDNTPTFTFFSSDVGSNFECSFDGDPFAACSGAGTATPAALTDGSHSFAVRGIDPATNPDPSPAARDFTVDATAPQTKITKKPKRKLKTSKKKAKAKFSFKSDPDAIFQYSLDGAQFKPCFSPLTVQVKAKGGRGVKHRIKIVAVDQAGNMDPSPAGASFRAVRKN